MICMPPVLRTVKEATEQIFALKLPKLTAVVFVVSGERDKPLTQKRFAFLRSKQLGQDGVIRSSVVQVEPHMVKHHVPCADILDPDKFVFTKKGAENFFCVWRAHKSPGACDGDCSR
jgi:hypothetical protein